MSFKSILPTAALLASLLTPLTSNASIVSQSDVFFGSDSITFDSSTNLQWLDLTKSTNRSYAYVSSQFGAGGLYEGFRYATHAELDQLELNFGFTLINDFFYVTGNGVPAFNFISLLGNTRPNTDGTENPFTDGLVFGVEVMVIGGVCLIDGVCDGSPQDQGHAFSRGFYPTNYQGTDLGSFLVRDAGLAVPEPVSLALVGTALVGLGFSRRRLKKS